MLYKKLGNGFSCINKIFATSSKFTIGDFLGKDVFVLNIHRSPYKINTKISFKLNSLYELIKESSRKWQMYPVPYVRLK